MLLWRANHELDALPGEPVRGSNASNSALTIKDEFLHGTMGLDPEFGQGGCQSLLLLIRDYPACMPTGASIQHVEDDVLVYKE